MPPRQPVKQNAAVQKNSADCAQTWPAWRKMKPLAQAVALMLAAGGMAAPAHAQRAFSGAWFASKGVVQNQVVQTGLLPNGKPASSLNNLQGRNPSENLALDRSLNNLNAAARAIAAEQAAQVAARQAALNAGASSPDGLAAGGLVVDTNSLTQGWLNANDPTQKIEGGRVVVGIEQTADKAILNWESFNVGKNTTVNFDQKGGAKADGSNSYIAFNRVNDPSGRPSEIAGRIKADGAVYIVNRNGIIFSGSAQVNTRSLVASSLALSDQQFKLGINYQQSFPDAYQGQGDAFGIPQFGDFTATRPDINLGFIKGVNGAPDTLGGVDRFDPGAAPGAVQVLPGAQLEAASGGKVMLFAPKVVNAGRISAPDGQVILAAGENVYLNDSRPTDKSPVRGLDVAVAAVPGWAFAWTHLYNALTTGTSPYNPAFTEALNTLVLPEMAARAAAVGYDVTNSGIVQSERGNITLQARDVHQNGIALATTALNNRNGSILLRAWGLGTHAYQNGDTNDVLLNWSAGTLTMGQGSVTQVMPDAGDTSEIETSALATRYQAGWIGMYGRLIDIRPQAGVLVPSGKIDLESAVNPLNIQIPYFRPSSLGDDSRVYIDSGAYLSVAGLQGAVVAMSRNFIEAELRINELRDSPLLTDSWVRGKKVIVDRRAGGIFTDGPMAAVEWVKDSAGVYRPGAWAGTPLGDVTGWVGVGKTDLAELSTDAGSIRIRAGGEFISREGSLLDVSGGSVRYADGMNTATKLQGADGRTYTMDKAMPDMVYTGIAGRYMQSHSRWGVSEEFASSIIGRNVMEAGYTEGRKAGSVVIYAGKGFVLEGDYAGGVVVGDRQQKQPSKSTGGKLDFGGGSVEDRPWSLGTLVISHDPRRLSAEFGAGSVLGDDFIAAPRPDRVEEATKLSYIKDDTLSDSGMGAITFHLRRDFTLEEGAVVTMAPASSFLINEFENSTNTVIIDGTVRAAGGSINATAAMGTLRVGANGRLDTSGQWINSWLDGARPARWAMDGGSIGLGAKEFDIGNGAVLDVSGGGRADIGAKGAPKLRVGNAGAITLTGVDATTDLSGLDLRAWSAGSAGSLNIVTQAAVQVGGNSSDALAASALWLPENLFAERGFGRVDLGIDNGTSPLKGKDIVIADGAQIHQVPWGLDLSSFAWRQLATGESLAASAPAGVRLAQDRLALAPTGLWLGTSGDVVVGTGAVVSTDTGGKLVLHSDRGDLTVRGTLDAPAGTIDLAGRRIALDAGASLLARGVPVIYTDGNGRQAGRVLDGGTVIVNAAGGELALNAGSLIDVSGASGVVDGARVGGFMQGAVPAVTLASNGGVIRIVGSGLVESTLVAHAGGAGARGGRLEFELNPPQVVGGTPLERLAQGVGDPDCFYFSSGGVDGICGRDWTQGLDFDWAPGFREWGYEIDGPMVIPSSLLPLLAESRELVVSGRLAQPGKPSPLDPVAFGLTPTVLDNFRDTLFYSDTLREVLQSPGQAYALTVRPAAFDKGGFADLSLIGTTRLDQVDLALGRSITVKGELTGHNGTSSSLRAPHIVLNGAETQTDAVPAPATGGSPGQLLVAADLLDLAQNQSIRIGGYGRTVLQGREIRIGGALPDQLSNDTRTTVHVDVDGDLLLRAGQVYPTTATVAVVRAGDSITVERLDGDAGSAALSAGATLRLEAPVIHQNGVLRVPFGQIELNASERLSLGAGSITSVSGAGVVVPYGTLVNNEHWHDPLKPTDGNAPAGGSLTAPPEKRITMKSPDVNLAKGAVVDIAGGGDLYAWEFVPGPGGSHDVLKAPGMFAILPGYTASAPVSAAEAGQRIWLAGGPGLAAGWYTLLPARYAMLPGAFAVQGKGAQWSSQGVQSVAVADGSVVMQGRLGDTHGGTQDAEASAWRVMSGATLRRYSEYNEALANDFFASEAFKLTQYRLTGQDIVTPRLPSDGGAVVFDATRRLVLDGTLRSQPGAGGRGGLVDIAGNRIAIVGAGQDGSGLQAEGYLVIDAASLSNFGAGSLLVGGKRSGNALGLSLEVTATDIIVRNGAGSELYGPEIILAASEQVGIEAGSIISTRGTASSGTGKLVVKAKVAATYKDPDGNLDDNGDGVIDEKDAKDDVMTSPSRDRGALVRLSAAGAAGVVRENVETGAGGLVRIGAGAVLSGGASLLIDATGNTELAGSARISAADLSVASGRIGFGGGSEGMVLDAASLAQLSDSSHLTLRSYSGFDFYRSVDLGSAGVRSLTFDGAVFSGYGDNHISVRGDRVALVNTMAPQSNGDGAAQAGGSGSFSIDAGTLVLGAGRKAFSGFDSVLLAGGTQITGEANGAIDAGASTLVLRTPLLTGRGGAAQSIATRGALQVQAAPGVAAADLQDSLGASVNLSGASIRFDGRAVALGGSVAMTATAGSLVVGEGAVIDVGGFAKQFFDVAEYADAGRITLTSIGGDVDLRAGSRLNLAAQAGGGSAGTLSLAASGGGTVLLNGAIAAQAGAGGHAGSFSLDIAALPDFSAFSQRLNDAGFNRSRQFRIRQGDVVVGGLTTVEDFGLTADQGSVDITGTVDARSAYGGAIRVTGGNGVAMQQGAQLLAGSNGELGSGRVTLEAAGGQLDLRGGLIDVAGNEGGKVRLRARQNAAHDDLQATAVNVRIDGARSAVLEGVSSYDVADYDGATVDSVKADALLHAVQFGGAAGAIQARLGTRLAVMSGITIASAGDLAMNSDWNLFTDFAGQREGTLTLRAGGNLAVNGHLSDGFDQAGRDGLLQQGASWNLRLVAGADTGSANTLALKPLATVAAGQGGITIGKANTSTGGAADIGAGWLVRTGTGDLEVRAGRDITLAHKDSVIYTAGRKDMAAWSDFSTANPAASYGIEGGNLDIAAQGGISAAPSGQRFSEWLNRQGNVNSGFFFGEYGTGEYGTRPDGSYGELRRPSEQSSWWINYGEFRQGVAALGGGNVKVSAGGDLTDLGVSLATNLRLRGGRSAGEAMALELRNGGAMTVDAGGAIRGGQYYVARGAADIRANETATGHAITVRRDDSGGSFTEQVFPLAPLLAMGDATMNLRTAGNLRLQTVLDPLLVRYGDGTDPNSGRTRDYGAFMSGYTARTALKLFSTGGDITLVNQGNYVFRDLMLYNNTTAADGLGGQSANRYPSLTHATAMNGTLEIQGPAYIMPGAVNDLRLLAQQDIRFDNTSGVRYRNAPLAEIIMSYATPEMMPSPFAPLGGGGYDHQVTLDGLLRNVLGAGNEVGAPTQRVYYENLRNPAVLALENDHEPSRIYAAAGSITGLDLTASEQTWTRAGTDIRGLNLRGRNVHASDTTLFEAGNDILAMAPLAGRADTGLVLQGAGLLLLSAGRDVYADQLAVQTVGNQAYDGNNRAQIGTQVKGLPSQGASIAVMAGMNAAAGYDAFASAYLDPAKVSLMPDYLKARAADGSMLPVYLTDLTETRANGKEKTVRRGLVSYMQDMTGETLAPLTAWARFQALPEPARQQFIRQVYMLELRDGGRDQNEPGTGGLPRNGGFNRGYAAIATLFPGDSWKGDIAANKLMLRTMAGGDINVLTPGGGVQVAALGTTVPDGYGLVTLASGHISVFAKDDVVVNRSRILSFVPEANARGSDQIIWSSDGDIDAGRGSKTVRVPSAPEVLTDTDGNTTVREKSDMSGSGIGTVGDGDVDLLAPKGTINAGDAGVRVAGNLNIAALQVLNADNIEVEGEIKGLPLVAAVNIGALSNASAAASQAAVAAQDVLQRERAAARQSLPSVFTVRVIGFGNEVMETAPAGKGAAAPANAAVQVSYDAGSAFQVLGRGRLDAAQRARLTESEQRRLGD